MMEGGGSRYFDIYFLAVIWIMLLGGRKAEFVCFFVCLFLYQMLEIVI